MFSKKRRSNLLRKAITPVVLSSSIFSCASQITNAGTYTWEVKQDYTDTSYYESNPGSIENSSKFMYKMCNGDIRCWICGRVFSLSNRDDSKQMRSHSHVCNLKLEYDDVEKCLTISGNGKLDKRALINQELDKKGIVLRKELKKIVVKGKVNAVSDFTFASFCALNSVDISHVSNLGSHLFGYCTNLEKVIFNENVETANFDAMFYDCEKLKTVTLPKKVKNIEGDLRSMFEGCKNLTKVENFPEVPKNCKSLYRVFMGCCSLNSLKIKINKEANIRLLSTFYGCEKLTDLSIDDWKNVSVHHLEGDESFLGCAYKNETYRIVPKNKEQQKNEEQQK